ncbi:MAG: hypothetical protein EBQ83_03350, partial [Burkholderiaceae bacterium]|nr:hypothetical protein [Burkholderiaceae bacterium]
MINITSPLTLSETISLRSGSGQIDLGAITLAPGVTLVLGNSSQSGAINLSSVTGTAGVGAVSNLTLYTSSAINVSGAIRTRIGNLILTNSSGANFNGSLGSSSDLISLISLNGSTGAVLFNNDLYATSLTNPASSFDIQFYGGTTRVVSFTTLNTSGSVYFGNLTTRIDGDCNCTEVGTPDTLTFDRGIRHAGTNIIAGNFTKSTVTDCSGADCGVNFSGTTRFVGASTTVDFGMNPIIFGDITLSNGVTLTLGSSTASGLITLGSLVGTNTGLLGLYENCPANLIINTSGVVNILRTIGTNVGSVTVLNSGGTTFTGAVTTGTSVVLTNTTGTIAFNGALTTP